MVLREGWRQPDVVGLGWRRVSQECGHQGVLRLNRTRPFVLDIGGEGRHRDAWSLNPRRLKTCAPGRGTPIPRRIAGRAESIPLPDRCVDLILMERTPLRRAALLEMRRVLASGGRIVLRHAIPPDFDPHALAREILAQPERTRRIRRRGAWLQESVFRSLEAPALLRVGFQRWRALENQRPGTGVGFTIPFPRMGRFANREDSS